MLDPYHSYSLTEMRKERPQFFKNALGPERYNVRKNHLIVTDLQSGQITVWQFHWVENTCILSPVWHPEHRDRGDSRNASREEVIREVERMLASGELPIHPLNGHNYGALRIEESKWLCPACNQVDKGDVTLEDHGVCYSCHHEMLNGERCRVCYEHCQLCDCEEEPEGYVDRYDPVTGRWYVADTHPSSTPGERNA